MMPSVLRAADALSPAEATANVAAGVATKPPVRMAFVYFPNGALPGNWWPKSGEGKDFEFNDTMKSLEKVKHQVQVMGQLDHINATPGPDGEAITRGPMAHSSRACAFARPPVPTFMQVFQSIRSPPTKSATSLASRRWSFPASQLAAAAIVIRATRVRINTISLGAAQLLRSPRKQIPAWFSSACLRRLAGRASRATSSANSSSNRFWTSYKKTPVICKRSWAVVTRTNSTTI